MISHVSEAIGDNTLNINGNLYAILSVIQKKCNLSIFMMFHIATEEAARRKTKWLKRWNEYEKYYNKHLNNENLRTCMSAIRLLQDYSGGHSISTDDLEVCTFFAATFRFFKGHWGNNHGDEVVLALTQFVKNYCDDDSLSESPPPEILQVIKAVQSAIGNKTLNTNGDLYAILSVIEEKSCIPVLAGNKIVVHTDAPQVDKSTCQIQ